MQFEAEKKCAVADTSILNLQQAVGQLEEEGMMRESQVKQLEEQKLTRELELETKKTDLEQLQEHHERTKEQIFHAQEELEKLRQELAEENRKLDSKKNEHALLKSLIDSMEGYPESVKFLHKNPHWNHTAPILTDIIYVQEEYRAAVENVLEPYLNYYIVNNLEEGLQAVHLLNENKKGKANFFLLDKVNAFESNNEHPMPAMSDNIPAMEVIEVDEKYRKLAENLLGNVFIADNEDALANSNGQVLLEKHGRYVKGKYSLTGGSVGIFEGKKIGRAKNLEKLYEEIVSQELTVSKLNRVIQGKHNEVIGYNQQLKENSIRQTEADINTLSNQISSIQNKIENLHAQQGSSVKRMKEMQESLKQTQVSIEGTRHDLSGLLQLIATTAEKLKGLEGDYKNAEMEYNSANAQYNEFNLHFTRQQSRINALQQELDFKNKQGNELRGQIQHNESQLKQAYENISENTLLLGTVEEAMAGLMHRKDEEEKEVKFGGPRVLQPSHHFK